jgi:hypothetical protein
MKALIEIDVTDDELCLEEPYSVQIIVDGRTFEVSDIREYREPGSN